MLKEAAANAAGPNASLGTLPPSGSGAQIATPEEQDMKDNGEIVQHIGSQ